MESRILHLSLLRPEEFTERLKPLLEDSIEQGFRMLARLDEEYRSGVNRFDQQGEVLHGIQDEKGSLIAIGGINQDPFCARKNVARIRRFYVHSMHRRRGHARFLLRRLTTQAATAGFHSVVLRATEPTAFSFYEAMGFIRIHGSETETHGLSL